MPNCEQNIWSNFSNEFPDPNRLLVRTSIFVSAGSTTEWGTYVTCPPETTALLSCGIRAPPSCTESPGVRWYVYPDTVGDNKQPACHCGKYYQCTK